MKRPQTTRDDTGDSKLFVPPRQKPVLVLDPEVAQRARGSMVEHSGTRPMIGRSALDCDHNNGL